MWFIYVGTPTSLLLLLQSSLSLLCIRATFAWERYHMKAYAFQDIYIPTIHSYYSSWGRNLLSHPVFSKRCPPLKGLCFGCRILERLRQSVRIDEVYTFIECVCYPSLLAFLLAFSLYLLQTCSFFCMCFSGKLNFLNGTTCNWVSLMVEMSGKDSVGQQHLTVSKI